MKKRFLALTLLCTALAGKAQIQDRTWSHLLEASGVYAQGAYVGTMESLLPIAPDTHAHPYQAGYSSFLDAVARGGILSEDAEAKLLAFIETHPHSAYLPYAQMRLGEYYFVKKNYRSAAYWFAKYDPIVFPDEMEQCSDYYLAFSRMREGQDAQALSGFRKLLRSPIYREEATFYTGYLLLKKGDVSNALPYLERMKGHPKYGSYAQALMAEGYLSQRKYGEALTIVQSSLAGGTPTQEVEASLLRTGGISSSLLGRQKESVDYLRRYMKVATAPGRVELLTLGKGLFEMDKHAEAVNYLHRVADDKTDFMSQLALYYEGLAQLSLKKTDAAQEAFVRGVAMHGYPPLTEALSFNAALTAYSRHIGQLGEGVTRLEDHLNTYPGGEYTPRIVKYLNDAYLHSGDASKSLRSLARIKKLPPALVATRERVKLKGANTLLGTGKTQEAYREYERIIQDNRDAGSVAEAYFWKGEAAYRKGEYQEAIRSTEQYLKHRPADLELDPNAYYNLGYAYYSLSDWSNAKKSFKEYLSCLSAPTADSKTTTYNRLGDIAIQERDFTVAQDWYAKAEAAGGAEADYSLYKKGMTYGLLKNYQAKADALAGLSAKYPQSSYIPEALYEQGRALSLLGNEGAASAIFKKVFEGYPRENIAPKAGVQLALTHFNANRMEEAARVYEQVIRKYPRSPEAKTALQDLKSISVELNRVDSFTQLVEEVGLAKDFSSAQQDSLAYLAAERVVAEGQVTQARKAIEGYLRKYPQGAFVHKALYNRAYLLYKESRYEESLEAVNSLLDKSIVGDLKADALKLKAADLEKLIRSGEAAEAYLALAHLLSDETQRSKAVISALERAVESSSVDFVVSLAEDVLKGELAVDSSAKAKVCAEAVDVSARSNKKDQAIRFSKALLQLPKIGKYEARARVVIALHEYDNGNLAQAQGQVQKVIDKGTSDTYWLARGFILLADIYLKKGDKATAKTYLESVKSNYNNANDGILLMIKERLTRL